ncbi:CPBP family intramembrane glutamic endopeptidase [Micromonospora sp. C95]|uniref:CPBP family intramembrane glutamic endopeptidase n=1 Tax=Micromonospora sp. C95 TaxID=2824882 RepID=UPI001B3876E0|nr:type II CAAX endopeptidase family protein [Micromonospora sp. C95]MBQ1027762.1 CPBP family intramembrane metalloprotease [Micromonospora sp. C95]
MTTHAISDGRTGRIGSRRPAWPEIIAGGAAYAASFLVVALLLPRVADDAVAGVVGLVVSGAMGLVAFAVAVLIRIRGLSAFGVRRATARQLLVAAALGLGAYILGTMAAIIYMIVSGDAQNVQTSYQEAANAGWLSLALTLVAGSVITPLGEEAFFRGVLANALFARYRAWIAVIASAAIFAVAHGINPVLPAAFVVGVLAALLFRWSGSIWPGVVLHAVNNAAATLVSIIVATAG